MKKNLKSQNKLSKIISYFILSLLTFIITLSIFLIIITQTNSFRFWAAKFLQDQINSELKAKIQFSDFRIHFLHGIEIFNLKLLAAGDTLAIIDKISIDYKFFRLFKQKAIINWFRLYNPHIKLLRSNLDSSWNFEHIAYPDNDTTEPPPFKWLFDIKSFNVINGTIIVFDSTSKFTQNQSLASYISSTQSKFDFNNLKIKKLNFEFASIMDFNKKVIHFNLKNFSLTELFSNIKINTLKSDISIYQNQIILNNFKIFSNDASIESNIIINNFNIFKIENSSIENAHLSFSLNANDFNSDALKKFLDDTPVDKGIYDIKLNCSGKLNALDINKLILMNDKTILNIHGNIRNLFNSSGIVINAQIYPSFIDIKNITKNIPIFSADPILQFDFIDLKYAYFKFSNDSISLKLSARTAIGAVEGFLGLNTGTINLQYSAFLKTIDFNPATLFASQELSGKINSDISLKGFGSDIKNLSASIVIHSQSSNIAHFSYHNAYLIANITNGGLITLDSLLIEFDPNKFPGNLSYLNIKTSNIIASGKIDFNNFSNPYYNLNFKLKNINAIELLDNNSAPQLLTANIFLDGQNFDIEYLNSTFEFDIIECLFGDRALIPFKVKIKFISNNDFKSLDINSDYMNAKLMGKFTYKTLLPTVFSHGENIADYIFTKFNSLVTSNDSLNLENKKIIKINAYDPIDLYLIANINDISPVSLFTDGIDINLKADFNLHLISDKFESKLLVDSLSITSFDLKSSDMNINSQPLYINGGFHLQMIDSVSTLSNLNLNIIGSSDIRINNLIFTMPAFNIFAKNDKSNFSLSSGLNDIISFNSSGEILFEKSHVNIKLNDADFIYDDKYAWNALKPVLININSKKLNFVQCEFYRYGAEKISLNGIINDYSKFENLNISISNIPLSEFNDFIADADVNEIQSLDGKVRKLNITFNDTFDNTQINIHSQIDSLNINNNYIGNIESKLNHRNHFISGNISAIPNATDKFNFNLDILSFPYNLSISTNDNRLSQTLPFDIDLKLTNLPLSILNPFIPAIEQLSGFASANLKFYGFAPDDLDYSGNIKLSAASFITEATNIKYYAEGNIDIAPQSIYLNHILLKNTSQDLPDGKAIITGSVKLNNTFDIEYIDILVRSDKILILNDASIKNIPYLYGNFIIATGDNPLHFFGTLDEPELTGDLNILLANLKMPQETAAASPKTIFRYEIFNPLTNITYSFPESTDNLNKNLIPGDTIQISDNSIQNYKEKDNPDFADIINYDLNIRFYGRFDVMMDMQAIFQLYANIGTYDRNIPIRYIKKRGKSEPTLLGDLYVKEGSQLNYLRTFKTKGLILFPTGSISNPGLNLEAIYTGLSYSNDKTFNYIVKIFITGTKENPNIKLTYSIDGDEPKDDSTQVTKDALSLLLFGKTFKDIQGGNGINLSDIANDAIYSGLSAGGSYLLNELFTGNGFIKNADIDLTGGIKEARLKLTGQLFGLGIEAGGTIADLASNSQISFIVPLSSLLNLSAINFNAQFTGTINPNTSQSSEQKDWEFKMNFGKRW